MKRFLSILLILNLILILPGFSVQATETDGIQKNGEPSLYSEAAIVIDAKTGQIIYEKNAYAKEYPASITKILTTLIALENGDPDSTITMSEDAVWGIDSDSSKIYLDVGEQISLKDALYAVMLVSANEAAWGVAEHIGGSLNAFCDMMNEKAASLGCVNSHFVNANGLSNDDHYTCAYDMALITKEALKNEEFCKITSTLNYTIPATNKTEEPRALYQGNRLIQSDSEYYYEYCQGGKTGYTQAAGGTLVAWASKDDMQLICVTLKTTSNSENYADTVALFNYCFDNYTYINPLENYTFSATELTSAENYLNNYYGGTNLGTMELSIDSDQPILIHNNSEDELNIEFVMSTEDLSDNQIGHLTISDKSQEYISIPVTYSGYISSEDEEAIQAAYANGTLKPIKEKKSHAGFIIVILIILAGGATALYLRVQYVRKQRKAYLKRREHAKKNGKSF